MKGATYAGPARVVMKTCAYCGKEHPDEATVCVIDKQPLSPAGSSSASTSKSRLSSFFSTRFCSIRTSCKILCGMIFVATVSFFAMEYISGRAGMPLALLSVPFPAQIIPVLIILFSSLTLAALCIVTLVQRSNRRLAFSMLVLSWLILLPGFVITPAKVFQIGFRQRINSTISPAELREITRACSNVLPINGRLPGPKKWSLWNETEHRAAWDALENSTALGKLDSSMLIFNHADSVEIAWGGALPGHWGVIIQKNGSGSGDIAPGIRTYWGN
jgi:hypothetical protein